METTLETYDFSPLVGFPVQVQHVPGLRCTKCEWRTLEGHVINVVLRDLTLLLTKQPTRLQREQAQFLRKRLRMSQQALADLLGISRETVGKWECGDTEISPQHDFMLRTLVFVHMLSATPSGVNQAEVIEALRAGVHKETTPHTHSEPFRMDLAHQHFEQQAPAH